MPSSSKPNVPPASDDAIPGAATLKPSWAGSGHPVLARMERVLNGGVFRYVPKDADDSRSAFVALKNYRARNSKKVAGVLDSDGSLVVFKSTRDIPMLDLPARAGLLDAFRSFEEEETLEAQRRRQRATAFSKTVMKFLHHAETWQSWENEDCANETEAAAVDLGIGQHAFGR